MKILVQKFGGSSVTTPELREKVVGKIINAKNKGYSPVVVVSAMGRNGDPYATDTLIRLVNNVCPKPNKRELDLVMSCGEIISAVVMATTLESKGYSAVALTGRQAGIVTDNNYSDAKITSINPKDIITFLKEDKVVIIAGFQGVTETGEITTLGRGGSDTTASAVGVALKAEEIEIYTDVDGIMTADPRIVPEARILETVTYHEICELAMQGAKVIHPRAVEIAMEKGIPIRVKCTFNNAEGTLIADMSSINNGTTKITNDRIITGVSYIPNVIQIRIDITSSKTKAETEMSVFKLLAEHAISLDLFNILTEAIIFTVRETEGDRAIELLTEAGFHIKLKNDCAKVSVVGAGMRGMPGIMAKVVEALNSVNVDILQTADSHTTISCLVDMDNVVPAVKALHDQFGLGN